MIKRICIFGDSITFGSGDLEFGGWQNHLKVWFARRGMFQHVYNLAVSGRTTDDIIDRFKSELLSRKSSNPDSKILAIIVISSNDTRFKIINKERNFEISEEHFKDNLVKLKHFGEENADKFIFVGITKVVNGKTNPWFKIDNGYSWKNKIIKDYNNIAEKFCQENNIPFCPMYDLLEDDDLPDGLHPNTQGHKKMFEQIKNFLEKEVL